MKKKVSYCLMVVTTIVFLVVTGNVFISASPTITVNTEEGLRQAVGQAGNMPTTIYLNADIELIANFVIPGGVDITITSPPGQKFNLTTNRNMDIVTIQAGAMVTIENILIERLDGTGRGIHNAGHLTMNDSRIYGNVLNGNGAGVRNTGTFIMNSGKISGNSIPSVGGGGGVDNTGTFTMNGGAIRNNAISGSGQRRGGGVSNSGVFTMNDGIITDNRHSAGGVSGGGIGNTGTFTMNGGTISNNIISFGSGGGVFSSGTFIMNDGTINGNSASREGGGVYARGTFTMSGGVISGNTAIQGGGVQNRDTFTMTNSTICSNEASADGGNVHNGGGRFTMESGTISNSSASSSVSNHGFMGRNSTFIMESGVISGGTGTGVSNTQAFTMNGGTIDNHAGRGVVSRGGTFNFNDGTINNNMGGGVALFNDGIRTGVATMRGGSIKNNISPDRGGGILFDSTRFTMYGGTIEYNFAEIENGSGIYQARGTFNFNGGWIFNNNNNSRSDNHHIGQVGVFNHNVLDIHVGAIGSPPPIVQDATITASFIVPNPVRDVTVELRQDTASGNLLTSTSVAITQANSAIPVIATFSDVPPGIYTLIFRQPGHTSFTINNVVVIAGASSVDISQDPLFPGQIPLRPGNATGSGQVNIADLNILLQNWMGDYMNANITGSGQINIADLNLLLQNWMAESVVIYFSQEHLQ